MPEIEVLIVFIGISLVLSLAPGPDNIYVFNQSLVRGWFTGVIITLGLCTGLVLHTLAVALGLAVLIRQSPVVLLLIQLFGAMYLLYLAWYMWRDSMELSLTEQQAAVDAWAYYRRGILMNLSNPKVLLFFLAFLPQFVRRDGDEVLLQILFLGVLFMLAAFLVFVLISYLAQRISNGLRTRPLILILLNKISALLFVVLAIHLLFQEL